MSLHRSIILAVAAFCSAGLSSSAFAGCCGWDEPAPTYYRSSGCGGCGFAAYAPITDATPIAPAPIGVGCGGCGTPRAVATYAPAPSWGTGCAVCGAAVRYVVPTPTGCGGCVAYVQPAPLYVVNQGPEYSGPGIMVPYRSWARPAAYTPYGPAYYRWHHYYGGYGYHAHAAGHYLFRGPYHPGHFWHG
jgi:hypothetical protein